MSVICEREYKGNHILDIFNKLNNDRKSCKTFCDVTINADSHEFSAHKPVLVLFCEFFEKLFMSEMMEKYSSSVNVHEISHNIMEIVISFIYTEKILITKENVFDVLAAADFMRIPALTKFCGNFLNDMLDLSNCLPILAFLRLYNLNKFTQKPVKLIWENFESLTQMPEFLLMNDNDFLFVLKSKPKKYSNEKVVYEAVINWINHDVDQRKVHLNKLFQCIDLEKFSKSFLQEVLMEEKLVMNSVECMQAIVTTAFAMADVTEDPDVQSPISSSPNNNVENTEPGPSNKQPSYNRPFSPNAQNKKNKQNPGKSGRKQKEFPRNNRNLVSSNPEHQHIVDVEVSKELAKILRHGKYKWIKMDKNGYCFVDDITGCKKFLDQFGKVDNHVIQRIVDQGGRKRFALKTENGRLKIRAIDKHTIHVEDLELVPILNAQNYSNIYHGTTLENWDNIKYEGLSRKRSKFIHFSNGMGKIYHPLERSKKYDIAIKLNLRMAMQEGLKFFVGANGGVVCEGDHQGKIDPIYFEFVKNIETNKPLKFRVPRDYGEYE